MEADVSLTQLLNAPDDALPAEPAKAFTCNVQTPPAGSFNLLALAWNSKVSNKKTVQEAFVSSDRVPDLIKGDVLAELWPAARLSCTQAAKLATIALCTTRHIQQQHQLRVTEALKAGKPLGRDEFLKPVDIRNCEHDLAETQWKLHQNEAQSVRMFAQQHDANVFIYKEQQGPQQQPAKEQPAQQQQVQKPTQPFVLGFATDNMKANAVKHGNNNLLLLDATFSTNHMKFPLYTGLTMDAHNNGLPILETILESSSQAAASEWLRAHKQYMQHLCPGWRPSCFMVDDAQGEINAIRYIQQTHTPAQLSCTTW